MREYLNKKVDKKLIIPHARKNWQNISILHITKGQTNTVFKEHHKTTSEDKWELEDLQYALTHFTHLFLLVSLREMIFNLQSVMQERI